MWDMSNWTLFLYLPFSLVFTSKSGRSFNAVFNQPGREAAKLRISSVKLYKKRSHDYYNSMVEVTSQGSAAEGWTPVRWWWSCTLSGHSTTRCRWSEGGPVWWACAQACPARSVVGSSQSVTITTCVVSVGIAYIVWLTNIHVMAKKS